MSVYILPSFVFNPKLVAANEINAWKDLLAPKWKGKLVMRDPRLAGGGLAIATLWYANPKLGKEFIQKIFTAQELALSRDDRQLLDFVGQGKYPIAIGPSEVLAKEWIGKGLPVRQMNPEALQEAALTTAGNGALSIPKNPPHPNALKVYLDYVLSKEGQTEWSKAIGFASLRQDVPRDHVAKYLIPKEGVQYPGEPSRALRQSPNRGGRVRQHDCALAEAVFFAELSTATARAWLRRIDIFATSTSLTFSRNFTGYCRGLA
jgi:iron(III) transport system substrate-binding protein